jgi:hypothetical protein
VVFENHFCCTLWGVNRFSLKWNDFSLLGGYCRPLARGSQKSSVGVFDPMWFSFDMFSGGESYLDVILVRISFYSGFCDYIVGYYWSTIFGSDPFSTVGLHRGPRVVSDRKLHGSIPITVRESDPIGLREWDPGVGSSPGFQYNPIGSYRVLSESDWIPI